ncbi:MAG: riboflavin synthase subunit alpha [Pseudomonadales bacterium]
MFTGIVQGLCKVNSIDDQPRLKRLTLELGELCEGLANGASVAVNGVCLTVTAADPTAGTARFDIIRESLDLTNLGDLRVGARVNVERSFRVGDEIGGHVLSGHVSGVATVVRIEEATNERNLFFRVPAALMKYLSYKGFVSLDGASLTLAHVDAASGEIGVCLIPETIERTTLGRIETGGRVNLEVDAQTQTIVETVERVLAERFSRTAD